jgi:pimeloyl-ACP methyl ester carboxylesterase
MGFDRIFVEVDGTRISFLKEEDLPLVYIHGSGCDATLWTNQLEEIGGYAVDLPNRGESGRAEIESVDDYAYYVAKAAEEVVGKAVFAGHSLGGAVAQKIYLNHREVVKALILVGTGVRLRVLPEILEGLRKHPENVIDVVIQMSFAGEFEEVEEVRRMFIERSGILLKDLETCDRFDLLEDFKSGKIRVEVPTLIVVGEEDRLTPVKYSQFLHTHIENSELAVIENAGHMVMLEQPEKFNGVVKGFISKIL